MIIYILTNLYNGKQYIGQTACAVEKRWQEHIYNASGNKQRSAYPLYHAIRKYGADSFRIAILDTALSQEELNQKEIDFIFAYNTLDKNFGYNRHEGGNRPPTHTLESRAKAILSNRGQRRTKETRKLMSLAALGKRRFLGKTHSEETKKLIGETHKLICIARGGGYRLGQKSSPEHIQKIVKALTGKKHSQMSKEKMRQSHLGKPWSEKRRAAWLAKKSPQI